MVNSKLSGKIMKPLIFRAFAILCLLYTINGSAAVDVWAESYRLEALTRYEDAAEVLLPALKKDSKNEFILLRLGWLNYLRGNHNKAMEYYKKALAVNSKSLDAKLGLVLPLLAQQRWNEAAKYTQEVLKVAPWNYYAHIRLMIAEEGLRQWQTLAKHAREVHARYPSDATVLVYLARANRWLGNTRDAKNAYQKVLERAPSNIEALQYLEEHK
jgi:tetratricopeptide (TPR) repeat protein